MTGYERNAVERLLAENPDVVLIAGDLHQGTQAEFDATLADFQALLTRLDSVPGGAFVVRGDSESDGELERLLPGTGVEWLDSEIAQIEIAGQTLSIGGVDTEEEAPWNRPVYEGLAAAPGLRILLAHQPDAGRVARSRQR